MAGVNDEIRAWARANGEQVSSRGNLPGRLKERFFAEYPDKRPPGSVELLPGPDDDWDAGSDDFDVIGFLEPDPEIAPRAPESHGAPSQGPLRYEAVPDAPQPPTVDSGPAHGSKEWRGKAKRDAPAGGRGASRKPTVTIRNDINAKISLVLEVPGRVWQARDPVCGTTFIDARPAIADALTEIVCNSPDLVAWFAGQGGQFMLWFNLIMAVWPVAMTVAAHHVYHSIEAQPADYQQPDYQDYAA